MIMCMRGDILFEVYLQLDVATSTCAALQPGRLVQLRTAGRVGRTMPSADGRSSAPAPGFSTPRQSPSPSEWRTSVDDEGQTYYWHPDGRSSYERPEGGHVAAGHRESPAKTRQREMMQSGGVRAHGKIEFPASKKLPARWVKVPTDVDEGRVLPMIRAVMRDPKADSISESLDDPREYRSLWNLPKPSVIFSVTGNASSIPVALPSPSWSRSA